MNRPSVDPAFTFGLSLAISLVLWFPTLRETMSGNIEITDAGIRYFLALAIAWAGVYGVSAMVAMYATASESGRARDPSGPSPRRRRGGRGGDPGRRDQRGLSLRRPVSSCRDQAAGRASRDLRAAFWRRRMRR